MTTPDSVGPMPPPLHTPGTDLPVRTVLAEVLRKLATSGSAVLVAPPGTGKTSLLPLAIADAVAGRVIVAEPRRIASRAAARRMAALLGEPGNGSGTRFAASGRFRPAPGSRWSQPACSSSGYSRIRSWPGSTR